MSASSRCGILATVALMCCRPNFDERESFVDRPRVIGVKIKPPEAKPGERVTATVLVAAPEGTIDAPWTSFAFCESAKLLTENGSVNSACQREGVVAIGDAPGSIAADIPTNACFVFGPDTQSAEQRPRDPDSTGGYFLPIRTRVAAPEPNPQVLTAFGFARVLCAPANASAAAATKFREEYQANTSPRLLPLSGNIDGVPVLLTRAPRGARVVLRAAWRPEDVETFALFEPETQTIVRRREAMRVSWFTTAGTFEQDRTGRSENETETSTENVWTAPAMAQRCHLFAVLRDGRGGLAFENVVVETQ